MNVKDAEKLNGYDDMLDGDLLQRAYRNTIELLKSNVEVEE